jgi:hypothetical protein
MSNKPEELEKQIIFRLPENLKIDLRVALMQHKLNVQHTLAAFAEVFTAYSKGEKFSDPIKTIIKRSQTLAEGS